MSREEIQITDLEPSYDGNISRYTIQVRGIDAEGRPGPWSEPLYFDSPETVATIESKNYVAGSSGWRIVDDGNAEFNGVVVRGDLASSNYIPGVSGWALNDVGDVEFSTGIFRGALRIGQNTFNVNSNGDLWIGGSNFNNAPFAVNTAGQIQAMDINGSFITANTVNGNRIIANTLNANRITAGTITADRIQDSTITGSKIANSTIANGNIIDGTIRNAKIRDGEITGAKIADATISGANIASATITAANIGNAQITNAKIVSVTADKITAGEIGADVIFVGQLNAATGTFSGNLSASTTQARRLSNVSGQNLVIAAEVGTRNLVLSATSNLNASASSELNLFAGGVLSITSQTRIETNRTIRITSMAAGAGISLVRSSNGDILQTTSSIQYKENVRSAKKIKNLLQAKPVLFDYKNNDEDKDIYGAIAEEFHELGLQSLVYYQNGKPESINYEKIGLALIPYVKELYGRIEELERKLNGS